MEIGAALVQTNGAPQSITRDEDRAGMLLGLLGVICFSLTLPATKLAIGSLNPTILGLGRALIAAILAAGLLIITRSKPPTWAQWAQLAVVALGVIVGFPLLSAMAMSSLPASHGAIVLALLPLLTALVGAFRNNERPSIGFWMASVLGSVAVLVFAFIQGAGQLQLADLALLGASVAAAVGYAEGARLAHELGGWQVICWALLLAAPFITAPVAIAVAHNGLNATPSAWLGFGYVSIVSQFLGMFAWYRGLALGGVARVSQLQLLQPFFTIVASALLLGEGLNAATLAVAGLVVATIAFGRRAGTVRKMQV